MASPLAKGSSFSQLEEKLNKIDLSPSASATRQVPLEWGQDLELAVKSLVHNWILQMRAAIALYTEHGKGDSPLCSQMHEEIENFWTLWTKFRDAEVIDGPVLRGSPVFYNFTKVMFCFFVGLGNVGDENARDTMKQIQEKCNTVINDFGELLTVILEALEGIEADGEEVDYKHFLPIPPLSSESVELPEDVVSELEQKTEERCEDILEESEGTVTPKANDPQILSSEPLEDKSTNQPESPRYHPISSSHPAVSKFNESVRSEIRKYLLQQKVPYLTTLLRNKNRPTVYIIVDADQSAIDSMKNELESQFPCFQDGAFNLDVTKGTISFCNPNDCDGPGRSYYTRVPNGASIGIENSPDAAFSLGFYLWRKNDVLPPDPKGKRTEVPIDERKEREVFAITAAHNVAMYDPAVDEGIPQHEMNIPNAPGTKIIQPALIDYKKRLDVLDQAVDRQKRIAEALRLGGLEEEAAEADFTAMEKQQEYYEYKNMLDQRSMRFFGRLTDIYELGPDDKHTDGQNILYDYAIIRVYPCRMWGNTICKPKKGHEVHVSGMQQLKPSQKVVKQGRTTGYTQGRVYHVESDVGNLSRFPNQSFLFQTVLTAGKFADKGDSGAGMAVPNGDAVGIVLGVGRPEASNWDNKARELTFVMDIERTLVRIKEKFGDEFEVIPCPKVDLSAIEDEMVRKMEGMAV